MERDLKVISFEKIFKGEVTGQKDVEITEEEKEKVRAFIIWINKEVVKLWEVVKNTLEACEEFRRAYGEDEDDAG